MTSGSPSKDRGLTTNSNNGEYQMSFHHQRAWFTENVCFVASVLNQAFVKNLLKCTQHCPMSHAVFCR